MYDRSQTLHGTAIYAYIDPQSTTPIDRQSYYGSPRRVVSVYLFYLVLLWRAAPRSIRVPSDGAAVAPQLGVAEGAAEAGDEVGALAVEA